MKISLYFIESQQLFLLVCLDLFVIEYLCILKNMLFFIAVDVYSNSGPVAAVSTESVDDSRAIREDYPQPL